jgi:hypothetical protein
MAVIHVRLFFYGLIALVDRGTTMHVLLIDHSPLITMPHTPFVIIYGNGCNGAGVDKCPRFDLFNEGTYYGFTLQQEQVEILPFTVGTPGGPTLHTPQGTRQLRNPAPNDMDEAEDLAWIPRMNDILGVDLDFDSSCLKPDPSICKVALAGRVALKAPSLITCSLVHSGPNCPGSDVIKEYSFYPNGAHQGVVQALGEVAAVVADIPYDGGYLTLGTKYFNGQPGPPEHQVKVKPMNCGRGESCIDILIGNVPMKTDDCYPHDSGPDFKVYYDFLITPPLHRPIPIANGQSRDTSVQPLCGRNVIFPPPLELLDRDKVGLHSFDEFLHSLNSRPVCAMVVF